jgi:hypothetical protein
VLPVISEAWVHAYINVQHICTPIRRELGKLRGWERAGFAGKHLHKISVLKYIYFFKTFYKI